MKATRLTIPDVIVLEPQVFEDNRGYFFESFNQYKFNEIVGRSLNFVQDNHSGSIKNVIRGLHYQLKHPQGKLVRVVAGEVFDVAVDLRKSSPTFGKWTGTIISEKNKKQLWIPEGLAHGFLVISDYAEVIYKVTESYAPQFERTIRWDDPNLKIDWPLKTTPLISEKDKNGGFLHEAKIYD